MADQPIVLVPTRIEFLERWWSFESGSILGAHPGTLPFADGKQPVINGVVEIVTAAVCDPSGAEVLVVLPQRGADLAELVAGGLQTIIDSAPAVVPQACTRLLAELDGLVERAPVIRAKFDKDWRGQEHASDQGGGSRWRVFTVVPAEANKLFQEAFGSLPEIGIDADKSAYITTQSETTRRLDDWLRQNEPAAGRLGLRADGHDR